MTRKTYAELQTALADNNTGNITPADLRDFLDSVSVQRARLWDSDTFNFSITQADTYVPLVMQAGVDDIVNSTDMTISQAGVVTLGQVGLVDFVYYLELDVGNLANRVEISSQLWASEDGVNWIIASGEDYFTKRGGISTATLRLSAEHFVGNVPNYIQPRIMCSEVITVPIRTSYITAKTNVITQT